MYCQISSGSSSARTDIRHVIFELIFWIYVWSMSCEIGLRWMMQNLTDD